MIGVGRELRRLSVELLFMHYRLLVPILALGLGVPLAVQGVFMMQGTEAATLHQTAQLLRQILPLFSVWCPAFALQNYVQGDSCELFRAYTARRSRQWRLVAWCGLFYLTAETALFLWVCRHFTGRGAAFVLLVEWVWQLLSLLFMSGAVYFLSYTLHSSMTAMIVAALYHCFSAVISVLPSTFPGEIGFPLLSQKGMVVLGAAILLWMAGWFQDRRYSIKN